MDILWAPWRYKYISMVDKDEGGCVFCRDDEYVVYKGRHCSVRLNKFPYNNGHLLIMPNRHIADLDELFEDEKKELFDLLITCKRILKDVLSPDGFNIGLNLGRVAGAGVEHHLHFHIVPRWNGDTNFMPVLADTKVISQSLFDLKSRLEPLFASLSREN